MVKLRRRNKAITDYWLSFYLYDGHCCSLCGNSGQIDTRLTAKTAAGLSVGKLNYCICPNGQALRWAVSREQGPRNVRP